MTHTNQQTIAFSKKRESNGSNNSSKNGSPQSKIAHKRVSGISIDSKMSISPQEMILKDQVGLPISARILNKIRKQQGLKNPKKDEAKSLNSKRMSTKNKEIKKIQKNKL